MGAGSETTTHLISGSVFELLKDPARRDLARGGLEPRRARCRRIFALRLAGAILQAALCAPGCQSRWRETEEGRPGDGNARRRQSGPGRERVPRTPRSRSAAKPAFVIRHRNSFLPRSPARAHRSDLRAAGAVHALARTQAGGRAVTGSLAETAGHSHDRGATGCGGCLRSVRSKAGWGTRIRT